MWSSVCRSPAFFQTCVCVRALCEAPALTCPNPLTVCYHIRALHPDPPPFKQKTPDVVGGILGFGVWLGLPRNEAPIRTPSQRLGSRHRSNVWVRDYSVGGPWPALRRSPCSERRNIATHRGRGGGVELFAPVFAPGSMAEPTRLNARTQIKLQGFSEGQDLPAFIVLGRREVSPRLSSTPASDIHG